MSIGERLKEARGQKPRADVAKAVGVSVSAIGMYEAGYRVPKDIIKQRLANYYGQTVEALFFGDKGHES